VPGGGIVRRLAYDGDHADIPTVLDGVSWSLAVRPPLGESRQDARFPADRFRGVAILLAGKRAAMSAKTPDLASPTISSNIGVSTHPGDTMFTRVGGQLQR
jgi:hypothetical protein